VWQKVYYVSTENLNALLECVYGCLKRSSYKLKVGINDTVMKQIIWNSCVTEVLLCIDWKRNCSSWMHVLVLLSEKKNSIPMMWPQHIDNCSVNGYLLILVEMFEHWFVLETNWNWFPWCDPNILIVLSMAICWFCW